MRIAHYFLMTTVAALCGIATAASAAECPLKADTVTTWTIDSVNPTEKNVKCLENSGGDCSLFGVVEYINTLLLAECGDALKAGTLNTATLRLRFKNDLDQVTSANLDSIANALTINLYSGLKAFIMDGALNADANGDPQRFQFTRTNLGSLLKLQCRGIDPQNKPKICGATTSGPAVEIRNIDFHKGVHGLQLSGNNATYPSLVLEHLHFTDQANAAVYVSLAKLTSLGVDTITVKDPLTSGGLLAGFDMIGVTIVDGAMSHVDIIGNGLKDNSYGIKISDGSKIEKLVIDDAQIENVSRALSLVTQHLDGYKNVTIRNSVLKAKTYPVFFSASGDSLDIKNVYTHGGFVAGVLLKSDSATKALQHVSIAASRFDNAGQGIKVEGNVHEVNIKEVELRNIAGNGILVTTLANIPAPYGVQYERVLFRDVDAPVRFESLPADLFTDGVYVSAAPDVVLPLNQGLDTPASLIGIRDSKNLKWVRIVFPHTSKLSEGELYWAHQGSWYPMVSDVEEKEHTAECDAGTIPCSYLIESLFNDAHFVALPTVTGAPLDTAPYLPYTGAPPLEDLSLAVTVTAGANSSMLSAPLSLLSPDWIDQEVLTIDTTLDDATLKQCTTKPADCSLRGAVALAVDKRVTLKKTHPFLVHAADGITVLPLSEKLLINVNNIKIAGTDAAKLTIVPASPLATEILTLGAGQQTLEHLILDGQGNVPTLVTSKQADHLILDSVLMNGGQKVVLVDQGNKTGVTLKVLQIHNTEFGGMTGKGIDLVPDYPTNIAHLKNAKIRRTEIATNPTQLVSGSETAPVIIDSVKLDFEKWTLELHGTAASKLQNVHGYLALSKHPDWALLPVAVGPMTYFADNTTFAVTLTLPDELTPPDLLKLGSMTVYLMGERSAANKATRTTKMSSGVVVNVDFSTSDYDKDGVLDITDNAPKNANPLQEDSDGDGIGDAGDPDLDGDNLVNAIDNCPSGSNENQLNADGDAQGDICDADIDGDGIANDDDPCKFDANFELVGGICVKDDDKDNVADGSDNCKGLFNDDQSDSDGDAKGDACDADDDNDGKVDGSDNCPLVANPAQTDTDGDDAGDACDDDDDDDGKADGSDNCPLLANADQGDVDGDALGNLCDDDDDGDGVADAQDNCPLDMNPAQTDTDSDGPGDACDAETLIPAPAPGTVDEQLQVDGAAPIPDDSDDDDEQPTATPVDSTPPPPEPVANAESGGCTLMLR